MARTVDLTQKMVREVKLPGGHKRVEYKITRTDGERMKVSLIEKAMKAMMKKDNVATEDMIVVGMNNERMTTLKGYGDELFSDYWEEEYLANKPEAIRDELRLFSEILIFVKV